MIGYNNLTPGTQSEWLDHVNSVITAFQSVKFVLVGEETNMPKLWRKNANVSCIDNRTFVTYCDVR